MSPESADNASKQGESDYGCATDLEGLPEDQPGQHPGAGVPGDRLGGDHQLQPAARRVPDAHPAEALVPDTASAKCRCPRSPRATSSRRAATSS